MKQIACFGISYNNILIIYHAKYFAYTLYILW